MSEEWTWDDPSEIKDDDGLFRWVRHSNVMPNVENGRLEPKVAALKFDPDGISVHIAKIVSELGIDRGELYDWSEVHAIEFPAEAPRSADAGVIRAVNEDDDRLGAAHGLVRCRNERPSKTEKNLVRGAILDMFEWVQEDPNSPARRHTA